MRALRLMALLLVASCANDPEDELLPDASGTFDASESADAGGVDATVGTDAGGLPPEISSFTATPDLLPRGGGNVRLDWSVVGADTLSIDPGVGDVTGQSSVDVPVTASTIFTLTAANASGARTATVSVVTGALFVDPINGQDTNAGTAAQPLRTIQAAAMQAMSGDTIFLMDGTHEIAFVQIPDGVSIRAVHTGVPRVQLLPATNGAFVFQGSSHVFGLHIGSQSAFGFFQVSRGTLLVEETHYTAMPSGGYPFVSASGTADVRLVAPRDGEWCITACNTPFLQATDDAVVRVEGGRIANFTNPGTLIATILRARISLHDVTIENGTASQVIAASNLGLTTNTSTVWLDGVTVRNATQNMASSAVFVGFGGARVTIVSSTIADNAGAGVELSSGGNYSTRSQRLVIERSRLENNGTGIFHSIYARGLITLAGTVISGNTQYGIECRFSAEGCVIEMTGGAITNNGLHGVTLQNDGNKLNRLKLRGVTVAGNMQHGLFLDGLAGSTFDLGTDVDPGLNTIRNNGSSFSGVHVATEPSDFTWAVGNTWTPNVQGADAEGRYIPAVGTYTEVSGPVTGENYGLVGGARIRR